MCCSPSAGMVSLAYQSTHKKYRNVLFLFLLGVSLLLITVGITHSLAEWTRTFGLRKLVDDAGVGGQEMRDKKGEGCLDAHRASEKAGSHRTRCQQ